MGSIPARAGSGLLISGSVGQMDIAVDEALVLVLATGVRLVLRRVVDSYVHLTN